MTDQQTQQAEAGAVIHALPANQFNSVIRAVRKLSTDKTLAIGVTAAARLTELKVNRDLSEAILTTPEGSDQFDPSSLVSWIKRVQVGDIDSVQQLIQIDATYQSRL